jgi:hypothetical protein
MTREKEILLIIKGTIADMPEEQRNEVMDCYRILKEMVDARPLTTMAIALIGAELVE